MHPKITRTALSATLAALPACGLEPDSDPPPNPPGRAIAYVSRGLGFSDDIFILSADARTDQNLTRHVAHDSWAAFSPDGLRMAFESNRDDVFDTEVYILTLSDSTVVRRTLDSGFADAQPAWSPLGNRIAFVTNRDSTGLEIYLMDTTGANLKRLTTAPDSTNSAQPAWSPDGALIAFATDRDGPAGVGEIYVMDSTGGSVANLTHSGANDLAPAWSPDGSKIAFMSDRDPMGFAVWVMNANGTNPVRVSPTTPCGVPSWTPDGLRIAFECDADVWVANADGSGLTQITRTGNMRRSETIPRWKPGP